jgi:hypothetical protein
MSTSQLPPTPLAKTRSSVRISQMAAFNHVTQIVLVNANITKALREDGIKEISGLISLDDQQVEDLTYLDSDPTNTTAYCLKKGEIGIIKSFIHYVHYRDEIGNPIGDDWRNITQDDFDQFCCNTMYTRRFASLASLGSPAPLASSFIPAPTPTTSHSAPSPVDLFKRGIKHDPSVYPTLKDELWNDNWHRSFANQARAQDLSDVLNAAHVPTTSVESDLFQEKQKFLYAVLESKVETAKGKAIIHKYERSFNAQKAYAELQTHHLTSTKASLSSVKILGYITSAKIGDGSWHGTAENFILNWKEQIRLYEWLTATSSHFSDEQKLTMLQTAVHPLQELRQVKATAALLKVHTKQDLDYEVYTSLLLSTASDYDSKHVSA